MKKRTVIIFIIFFLSFLLFSFDFSKNNEPLKQQSKTVSPAVIFPENDWSLPLIPQNKSEVHKPDVPKILFKHSQDKNSLINALLYFHPDKRISQDFYYKLKSKEAILSLSYSGQMPSSSYMTMQFYSDNLDENGWYIEPKAILIFNYDRLEVKTVDDVLKLWSYISHEYVHYLQDVALIEKEGSINKNTYLKTCEARYYTEREAYYAQCKLAVSWGIGDLIMDDGGCLYDGKDFDHLLFNRFFYKFAKAGYVSMKSSKGCLQTWAKIAGHPNPEKFKGW